MKFEFLEHTADIKFRIYGKTLEKIFENSVLAFSNYVSRGGKIKTAKKKAIEIEGKNNEEILYRFLDELIYLIDAEEFVVAKAKVEIKYNKLKAVLFGDDTGNYKDLDYVKAATYAEMYVKQVKNGWEAQVVLDV